MKWWTRLIQWLDLNRDQQVTGADLDLAKELAGEKIKDANEAINKAVIETQRRTKRVKKEVKDVVEAVKEVGNQIEDVAGAAVTKKKRPGRKKKTD